MTPCPSPKNLRAGFSLVEVALALLVCSIGLVTVMGLFPTGMEANRIAIDDTQIGLFADDVMSGMRTLARTEGWSGFAEGNPAVKLTITAPDMWASSVDVVPGPGRRSLKYVVAGSQIEDLNIQYELRILTLDSTRKGLLLHVWNGLYGTATTNQSFYSELYRYE